MQTRCGSARLAQSLHHYKLWERSMRSEIQWPGDAVAAPICRVYSREDVFFDSLEGRLWNRDYRPSDEFDADPAAAIGCEGFGLSAAALRPEFPLPAGEPDHRRDLGKDRRDGLHAGTASTDFGW